MEYVMNMKIRTKYPNMSIGASRNDTKYVMNTHVACVSPQSWCMRGTLLIEATQPPIEFLLVHLNIGRGVGTSPGYGFLP